RIISALFPGSPGFPLSQDCPRLASCRSDYFFLGGDWMMNQLQMNLDALYSKLTVKTNAKLALVVLDGLGDIATQGQGEVTPLEAARTPNLDALVAQGCAQGRMIPVAPGITPGSGPGHLGLFGYD